MESNVYPTIKNTIFLCLIYIGLNICLGLLSGIMEIIFNIKDRSILSNISFTVISIICFGIVVFIGYKKTKRSFNSVFKFNKISPFLWFATTVFMMGAVIIVSEIDNILNWILPMPELLRNVFELVAVKNYLFFSIILMVIIPAIAEEMLFRGLILDGLNRNYSNMKAIIVSALVFGIIHLNPWQFQTAFLFGLFSAWVCLKTNSILLPIYMHFFNNFIYLLAARYRNIYSIQGFKTNFETPGEFQLLWFNFSGIILLVFGFFLIKKGLQRRSIITY